MCAPLATPVAGAIAVLAEPLGGAAAFVLCAFMAAPLTGAAAFAFCAFLAAPFAGAAAFAFSAFMAAPLAPFEEQLPSPIPACTALMEGTPVTGQMI